MMKKILPAAFCLLILAAFFSCKKDSFISSADAQLSTSIDTLKFDTVFVSTGSVTRAFKIFNNNDQKLKISSIRLGGGASSPFRININGSSTSEATDIILDANDSMYVFVSVTVNPNTSTMPFILSDSIEIKFNGNSRFVQLQAYGQNAVFLNNTVISSNTVFSRTLPYVVLGNLKINAGSALTLEAGTRIFSHANAPILVEGTLVSNGTVNAPVIFSGDRLDDPYDKFPASWPGIYLSQTSNNNVMNFTTIRNASQAIVVSQPASNSNPKLIMHQCTINNAFEAGILSINSSIEADNSLFYNCGTVLQVKAGGAHIPLPIVILQLIPITICCTNCLLFNWQTILKLIQIRALRRSIQVLKIAFFWAETGIVDNEIFVDKQGSVACNVVIDHCLYKAATDPANSTILASVKNEDPKFDSIDVRNNIYDFHTTRYETPVFRKGIAVPYLRDIDNMPRSTVTPDIGAYEKQ